MSEDGDRLSDIGALIRARDTQQARANQIVSVAEAENVVGVARTDELAAAAQDVMDRWDAACRQVARARRDDNAEEIAEAEKRQRQIYAEVLPAVSQGLAEVRAILAAGEESLQEVNEQVESVLGAREALDDALAPATMPLSQALLTAAEEATRAVRAIGAVGQALPDEITTAADDLDGIIGTARHLGMDMMLTRAARSFLDIIHAPCWTPDIQDRLDERAPAWTALAHALETAL